MQTQATPTYDDHVKAIADAFDADFAAALALHEAQQHRIETQRSLRLACKEMQRMLHQTVVEVRQTSREDVEQMFHAVDVDVEIPRLS